MKVSRRHFFASTLATPIALGANPFASASPTTFPGKIVGASSSVGHLLREGKPPPPEEETEIPVVIVGGGIAGLSAARRLQKRGREDFLLLELENEAGGNSAGGRNRISAYPWGAHYVPLPDPEMPEIVELFRELGIIVGQDAAGLPVYNEFYLCADPMERLFLHGRWQDGLVPQVGVSAAEREHYEGFFGAMESYKGARGRDGKRAFSIPVDRSSSDPAFRDLDKISMAEYLRQKGWDSAPLRWYIDYCCRDDYGGRSEDVSAWAGIHYFAARAGKAANAASQSVVTWPEGNGWLVNRLKAPLGSRVKTGCLVWRVASEASGATVDYFDLARKRTVRVKARAVIFAGPRFVANRVVEAAAPKPAPTDLSYSPWMVAAITLKSLPTGRGVDLAWDNVIYQSASLGYVVATHQNLHPYPKETVLSYYLPLSSEPPVQARQKAAATTHQEWCRRIVEDLSTAHPKIANQIANIDVWLWGHGMIRPVPGFMWGETRARMLQPAGNVFFAHSDMSGISIFEEAHIRGLAAADAALKLL